MGILKCIYFLCEHNHQPKRVDQQWPKEVTLLENTRNMLGKTTVGIQRMAKFTRLIFLTELHKTQPIIAHPFFAKDVNKSVHFVNIYYLDS